MLKQNKKIIGLFLLVFGLFSFISLNRHSLAKPFTYHSELWADKAGYNVYLPALFIYDFDVTSFPKKVDSETGNGFTLDTISGKIITKYPYGVSLLQSPFWLMAHSISNEKNGYSFYYLKSIDIAGSFYLTLGLFFLFFIVRNHYSINQSVLLSLTVILSSGIFYYGIFETGMSHIFSFCGLAIILYLLLNKNKFNSAYYPILLVTFAVLYVIVRPINALFLSTILLYFLYINEQKYFNRNSITSINIKQFFIICLIAIAFILPQLFYYKYAFGSFIAKSYQNESFEIPTISRITELLFSPNNGLLIYYPICLILIIYNVVAKHKFTGLVLCLFITYILVYASWWSLSLGCGFGHRAMNDIFILLFIPFLISPIKLNKMLILTFILLILVNIKFIFSYDSCFYNSLNWDFTEYRSILFGDFK